MIVLIYYSMPKLLEYYMRGWGWSRGIPKSGYVHTCKPCIDRRFVVKSFGRKNPKCQAVFDDVPQGEEGEANEEA